MKRDSTINQKMDPSSPPGKAHTAREQLGTLDYRVGGRTSSTYQASGKTKIKKEKTPHNHHAQVCSKIKTSPVRSRTSVKKTQVSILRPAEMVKGVIKRTRHKRIMEH